MKPTVVSSSSFLCVLSTEMGKYFASQEPLTKVVRGSETSNLHILLIVRPALQNRGYSLEPEKKRRIVGQEKGKANKKKNRMRKREIKWRRGVLG